MVLASLTTVEAASIGESLEAVTVPEASVTASATSLASVTVPAASVACKDTAKAMTRQDLLAIVRGNGSLEERLAALDQVWEQDDVFYLFFKPGTEHKTDIRVSAVERIVEVDILKALAGKVGVNEVDAIIAERLKRVFPNDKGQRTSTSSPVARAYAGRLRSRE